jgi:pyruvate kinase
LDIIRQLERKYEHPIAILGDLQGPKLRVGKFANPEGEMLQTGQTFRFDLEESPGTNQRVMLPHPEIVEASERGHVLLVDDGKVKLEVTSTGPGYIDCVVGTLEIPRHTFELSQFPCFDSISHTI